MKNLNKLLIFIMGLAALIGCKPGPITLGGGPTTTVTDASGTTHYVSSYHVDKKRMVTVPAGLKGSDLTTAKIRAAYAQDSALSPYNIDVSTHRGVVTLSGKVPSSDLRSYAVKIARYNKGVLAVNDKNLVVTGQQ